MMTFPAPLLIRLPLRSPVLASRRSWLAAGFFVGFGNERGKRYQFVLNGRGAIIAVLL
jgi:hypothetical protein